MKKNLAEKMITYKQNLEKTMLFSNEELTNFLDKISSSDYEQIEYSVTKHPKSKMFYASIGSCLLAALFYLISTEKLPFGQNVKLTDIREKNQIAKTNSLKNENIDDRKYFNWTNLRIIELTDEELEKIGIVKTDSGYIVITERYFHKKMHGELKLRKDLYNKKYVSYNKAGYPKVDKFLLKEENFLKLNNIRTKIIPYKGWSNEEFSLTAPIAITSNHYKGKYNGFSIGMHINKSPILKGSNNIGENLLDDFANLTPTKNIREVPVLTKLVSLKIKIGFKSDVPDLDPKNRYQEFRNAKVNYAEFILWYYPTEEFLDAIPIRFSKPLRKELGIFKKIETGEIKPNDACKELNGEQSFFGLCNFASGGIHEITLYPNPASGATSLKLHLIESRKIDISIYDQSGRMVRSIEQNMQLLIGTQEYNIDLSGFNPGFYIISIKSDKGEEVIQKLFVN
ncbi:MAG: type sorting protein [Ignavibacteria bacterium]|nr:type sorting protein [Ignavibacteria bacterium]